MKGGGNCYKYVLRVFNQRSLILAEHFRIHEVKRKNKQLTSVKQAIILFLINLCMRIFSLNIYGHRTGDTGLL